MTYRVHIFILYMAFTISLLLIYFRNVMSVIKFKKNNLSLRQIKHLIVSVFRFSVCHLSISQSLCCRSNLYGPEWPPKDFTAIFSNFRSVFYGFFHIFIHPWISLLSYLVLRSFKKWIQGVFKNLK